MKTSRRSSRRVLPRGVQVVLIVMLLLSSLSWSTSALAAYTGALTNPTPPAGSNTFVWTVTGGTSSNPSFVSVDLSGCWLPDQVINVSATDASGHQLFARVPGRITPLGRWNGMQPRTEPAPIVVIGAARFPLTITATFNSNFGSRTDGTLLKLITSGGPFGFSNNRAITVGGPTCEPAYALNLSATTGGTATADPPATSYAAGTDVSLSATPDPGYAFSGWTIDGQDAGSDNPHTLTMDTDHTVVANFTANYALTLNDAPGGNVVADPTETSYAPGTHVSLSATADDNFTFAGWTIDGQDAGTNNPYDLTMDQNHVVTPNFVADYTLTLTEATGGSASADPPGPSYAAGSQVSLSATPDDGYSFAGWTIDGSDMGTQNPYQLTMNSDHTVVPKFTQNQADTGLPPDPSTVATTIDQSVVTNLANSVTFLYTGSNPIQTGVEPGTIDPTRIAVLRGKVLDQSGDALPGVSITILSHPEFGATLSRADGLFDLAVNGGGQLTVQYQHDAYLTVQRQVQTPWEDYTWLPDVVLLPFDSNVSTIDLSDTNSAPMQVARGGQITDQDGTRQATVLFPEGTAATMTLPDGSTQALTTLHVRATEYTVGSTGPAAMPGDLPATSGYTYAVELSIDEAEQAGAASVSFNQPVPFYVDNFLGFDVGSVVPVGYYDRGIGQWIPEANGVVIKVLSITDGMADLDTTGAGTADNGAAIGITDAERTELATLYAPGSTLWRVALTHFSPWDCNWPYGPPAGAAAPRQPKPRTSHLQDKDCLNGGSIVGCLNQTLGESVQIDGTRYALNYTSGRAAGRTDMDVSDIQLSGPSIPANLQRIDLQITVAGRLFEQSFSAAPNLSYHFTWDELDAYGRPVQGEQPVTIKIGYVYQAVYYATQDQFDIAFAQFGMSVTANSARQELTIWQTFTDTLGHFNSQPEGTGGWTLDVHHVYDPNAQVLYAGDGSRRSAQSVGSAVINTIARPSDPEDLAVASDGSVYTIDSSTHRILKVAPNGRTTVVAGNGTQGYSGDGGPATQASLRLPRGLAIGPDGAVYISDWGDKCVRKVSANGIITTIAGTGQEGYAGDNGPATQATFRGPEGVMVGPDGSVFVADGGNGTIRKISPNGIITTVAGTGDWGFSGDNGLATRATLNNPKDVALGPDGSLYIADTGNNRIRKIAPNGVITTVAGTGKINYSGDGGIATKATLYYPQGVAVAPDGSLYIADEANMRVRKVSADGIIRTVAGSSAFGPVGDGGFATRAGGLNPTKVDLGPDGILYIAEPQPGRIRKVSPALPVFGLDDILVSSEDGHLLYQFNTTGRHLRTLDALTNATIYTFGYDTDGRITTITDAFSNVTTIQHDANGNPTAIIAPGGQTNNLTVDSDGYLASITDADGNVTTLTSKANGLLTSLTDPNDNLHQFVYDEEGRLTKDAGPDGGFTSLARTELDDGYQIVEGTAMGRSATYKVETLSTGDQRLTTTDASGGVSVATTLTNGTQTASYPDGSTVSVTSGPDPRWGMMSPVLESMTRSTPGGLKETTVGARTARTAANNPLNLSTQTDTLTVNGRSSTSVYDAASHTYTLTDSTGHTRIVTVTPGGQIASETPADGIDTINYSYDAQGHLIQVTQGNRSVIYAYDSGNNLISRTDAGNNVTSYVHDPAGHTIQITLPGGEVYQYGYDANGNMTSVTMPNGAVHNLDYTTLDQLTSYLPPQNGSGYQWSYNLDRELSQFTLPDGQAVVSSYDDGGRILSDVYAESSITYGYGANDPTDRVSDVSLTPSSGPTQIAGFSYDGSLVVSASQSGSASASYQYTYDNNWFLTGLALTAGSDTVNLPLTRDADGSITTEGPFSITRDGPGGLASQITDGTMTATMGYAGEGGLATRDLTIGSTTDYSIQLTYDDVGRVSQKIETVSGVQHTFVYTYDPDGQLTQVTEDGGIVESYGYDANGNRTSATTANTPHSATYDSQDRLTALDATQYVFEVNGFLTNRGSDTFSYDTKGQLLTAAVGGTIVSYAYDGLGRRVGRTVGSNTIEYLYGNPGNPFQLTAERDDTSGILTTFFYNDNGMLFAFQRAGSTYYVATDQVGSPRVVTDDSGTVVKQIDYDSFGQVLADSDTGFDLPIGFAGGLTDSVTGLVHFGYRDYEPVSGRWTTHDPSFFQGGQANLYAYVGNNPVTLRDPLGMMCVGGSFYEGVGAGVQICHNDKGTEVCVEVGFGAGGSFDATYEGGPKGDESDNSQNVFAEAEVEVAGMSLSSGVTLDSTGCAQLNPLQLKAFGVTYSGENGGGLSAGEAPKVAEAIVNSKPISLQAKVGARVCHRIGGG
jgi:RHS repeat-associated protein